tara:strand:- start:571 stop:1002 length:432 start_codon:yes stop_codon:yes gene_type:complete
MTFILDFLDYDVSKLIGIYIEIKYNQRKVVNQLKDNILFTTHINYYNKYFEPNEKELNNMIENKTTSIQEMKVLQGKRGWIEVHPEKFSWKISRDDVQKMLNVEGTQNNFILKDKSNDKIYRSYPPHSSLFKIDDLIQCVKMD